MRLLVMAHTGEAQSFFKEYKLIQLEGLMPNLYKSDDFYLLISGEGRQLATQRLSYCLGLLKKEISEVINLGIAGSLTNTEKDLRISNIVKIRTCYLQGNNNQMEFKSYSTENEGFDLVTSNNRVLDKDQAKRLACFGSIVDRETWAIGSTCYAFKIKWSSYKYISDYAGLENEICERLKENALIYSDSLLEYFQETILKDFIDHDSLDLSLPFELYLTKTQYRQLNSLIKKLTIKYKSLEDVLKLIDHQSIIDSSLRPKEKSKQIIDALKDLLTPFNTTIKNELNRITSPISKGTIKFKFDPQLEKKEFHITATINNNEDVMRLTKALSFLDVKKIHDVFDGEIDV